MLTFQRQMILSDDEAKPTIHECCGDSLEMYRLRVQMDMIQYGQI